MKSIIVLVAVLFAANADAAVLLGKTEKFKQAVTTKKIKVNCKLGSFRELGLQPRGTTKSKKFSLYHVSVKFDDGRSQEVSFRNNFGGGSVFSTYKRIALTSHRCIKEVSVTGRSTRGRGFPVTGGISLGIIGN
ncbi:MAG: hypothetical protein M9962_05845 [Oligoflexia bacterium]|nr:hypothetical protein [Oligoflexia bacterium]